MTLSELLYRRALRNYDTPRVSGSACPAYLRKTRFRRQIRAKDRKKRSRVPEHVINNHKFHFSLISTVLRDMSINMCNLHLRTFKIVFLKAKFNFFPRENTKVSANENSLEFVVI